MSLPSRSDQIKAVMAFLDQERHEGRSLEEIAREIVDGYHKLLVSRLRAPVSTARLGMLFKTPVDSKVRRFVWEGPEGVWILGDSDSYGWLGPAVNSFFELCEEYRPKRREVVDGKARLVEMSDEDIERAWSNPDYHPADKLSQHQRQHHFEVVATGPQSVLLRNLKTGFLSVDTNTNLDRYYRREREEQEW